MAGIQVSRRSNGHVFCAHAASGYTFYDTRSSCKVYHIMVEIKVTSLALSFAVKYFACQTLVFRKKLGHIGFLQCIGSVVRGNNRLNGKLLETQVCHMENVVCKVRVIVSICAAHIVVLLVSGLGKLFKGRENHVVSAFSPTGFSHIIVDIFSSVETDDHVAHFLVGKVNDLVIKQNSVCCKCKTKILVVFFFLLSPVCD